MDVPEDHSTSTSAPPLHPTLRETVRSPRRRRPTGAAPPLPYRLQTSGIRWLVAAVVLVGLTVAIFARGLRRNLSPVATPATPPGAEVADHLGGRQRPQLAALGRRAAGGQAEQAPPGVHVAGAGLVDRLERVGGHLVGLGRQQTEPSSDRVMQATDTSARPRSTARRPRRGPRERTPRPRWRTGCRPARGPARKPSRWRSTQNGSDRLSATHRPARWRTRRRPERLLRLGAVEQVALQ